VKLKWVKQRRRAGRAAAYQVEANGKTILLSNDKRHLVSPTDRSVVSTWSMQMPLRLSKNTKFAAEVSAPADKQVLRALQDQEHFFRSGSVRAFLRLATLRRGLALSLLLVRHLIAR
jgi:hypothetical protein